MDLVAQVGTEAQAAIDYITKKADQNFTSDAVTVELAELAQVARVEQLYSSHPIVKLACIKLRRLGYSVRLWHGESPKFGKLFIAW